jgi:hypothetical protein
MRGQRGQIHHTYSYAIKGFSATLPEAAYNAILKNPNVDYVEQDATVYAWQTTTQTGATWGIDRIDQRDLPLNQSYTYEQNGAGVLAYIIDTGIRASHVEFTGRIAPGFTAILDGRGTADCNGHGTHVAGTVGGTRYGVAKGVTLVPVRVLNCQGSGTWSGVIAGIDWVTGQKNNAPNSPMVANMSLGGGGSDTVDTAVSKSVTAGVVYAVAAGNSNANACNYSPARAASALTVGSTTSSDARSSFSNFGTCVDLFAPGSSITSAWHTRNNAINTISGTSMASPHVAGVGCPGIERKSDSHSCSSERRHSQRCDIPGKIQSRNGLTQPAALFARSPANRQPQPYPTSRSTSGPWKNAEVSPIVTDNAALASVRVELMQGTGVVDWVTYSVSGLSASGETNFGTRGNFTDSPHHRHRCRW